ncbi:MAG TPA: EamA family transporter [Thiobacillus sp.]
MFLTDFCPPRLRAPLAFLIDALAAIPSVVLGLWGFLAFAPWLQHTGEPWLQQHFGFLPFFQGTMHGLRIPSGLISVIFGLSPLVTGVFAALWLGERTLTPIRLAGLGLALTGLWLIFGQPWPGDGRATLGTLAVLAGMTVQALGLVWIKRLNLRASSLAITTGSLGVAAPLFVLAWAIFDAAQLPPATTLRAGAAIVYLGVLGSVVGFTLYYYVIKHLDAGRVALIMLVTPVNALLLGQTLNRERIPAIGWAGIALIGMGLLLYEWQALRGLKSASSNR